MNTELAPTHYPMLVNLFIIINSIVTTLIVNPSSNGT